MMSGMTYSRREQRDDVPLCRRLPRSGEKSKMKRCKRRHDERTRPHLPPDEVLPGAIDYFTC